MGEVGDKGAGMQRNWKNFAQYFVQKEEEIVKKEMGEEEGGGGGGGSRPSRSASSAVQK